ncbi:hypothetical protein PS870_06477 [Pseudomonas fluorescens]|uniref:Uncharacterized protein n=1 Tax=Pseudomonas fluorescens TaxID=294 RepID=A0A5E7QI61_PSEFL|nr:hypothetical protein [Pseudomonas fluorescens]VVP61916.1 hypothetical protein PS870_06477 [Pseudomonas fluorescens]
MKKNNQHGKSLVRPLLLIAFVAIAYNYFKGPEEKNQSITTNDAQITFEDIRTSKSDLYHNAKNEILQSEIFHSANTEQNKYWQNQGLAINNWTGKVNTIDFSEPSNSADIEIESNSRVTYKQNNIPKSSAIFAEISKLKEGDTIYFSGEFSKILKGDAGAQLQEGSVTQYGSLYNPTYGVHLSQIYLPSTSAPAANLYAPAVSSETDTFDQSNNSTANKTTIKSSPKKSSPKSNDLLYGYWACSDKLVAGEIYDSITHYPDLAAQLALTNDCIDIRNTEKIVTVGHNQFVVPAGKQYAAIIEAYTTAEDGSSYRLPGYYYLPEKLLSAYLSKKK